MRLSVSPAAGTVEAKPGREADEDSRFGFGIGRAIGSGAAYQQVGADVAIQALAAAAALSTSSPSRPSSR